jgi:alkylation response protein AidB-like acyl-CoA dehydrogenase
MTESGSLMLDPRELSVPVPAETMEFLDVVGQFAAARLAGFGQQAEETGRFPGGLIDELSSQGLLDLGAPVEQGGGGADLATVALVVERLSEVFPVAAVLVATAHAARDAMGDLSGGDVLGASPVVIHTGGPSTAVQLDEADGVVLLHGTAYRVDGVADASAIVVTDAHAGPVLIDATRCRFGEPLERAGLRGWSSSSVHFDKLQLTVSPGVPASAFDRSRRTKLLLLGAAASGVAIGAWRAAASYAENRVQFGRRLDAIPAVAGLLDDALAAAAGARREITAAAAADDDADVRVALKVAQRAARAAVLVGGLAIQVHGGYGYLSDYPVERALRDAITLQSMISGVVSDGPAVHGE